MPSAMQIGLASSQIDMFPLLDLDGSHLQLYKGKHTNRTTQYIESLPTSSSTPSPPQTKPGQKKPRARVVDSETLPIIFYWTAEWPNPKTIVGCLTTSLDGPKAQLKPQKKIPKQVEVQVFDEGGEEVEPQEREKSHEMVFKRDDSLEEKLAKSMFHRCTHDLKYRFSPGLELVAQQNLFWLPPEEKCKGSRWLHKVNALIWVYSLNPEEAQISFDWVCEQIGHDPEKFRHMYARVIGDDIKRMIKMIASKNMMHALVCSRKLSDYLNVKDWRTV